MVQGGERNELVPGRNTMEPLGDLSERPCLNNSDHTSSDSWSRGSTQRP